MDQENKLLKEREKERSELMKLDLDDSDHMIVHLDKMKDKYVKMKNLNENELKDLIKVVIDLKKEKESAEKKLIELKEEEKNLQIENKQLATDFEKNKEKARRDLE